ncbi:hypothetical protein B0H14DRAFT_2834814, partial [Mycena olivaceomarginata]
MSSITSTVFTTAVASASAALATHIQTGIGATATPTATGELSAPSGSTGLSFQALDVVGEVAGPANQVLSPDDVRTLFSTRTATFTSVFSVVESHGGAVVTLPVTSISRFITSIPVATITISPSVLPTLVSPFPIISTTTTTTSSSSSSTSVLTSTAATANSPSSALSKSAAPSKAGAIAGGVLGAAILLIGILLCLFLRRRQRSRSRNLLTDPEHGLPGTANASATAAAQPFVPLSAASAFLARFFGRGRTTRGTQISDVQRPEPSKESANPFDDSNATRDPFDDSNGSRASWASYIDSLHSQEPEPTPSTAVSTRESIRELYLFNQASRAQAQAAKLEEATAHMRSSTMTLPAYVSGPASASGSGSVVSMATGDERTNADDSEARGVEDQLKRAMKEIEGLNSRIQELEVQRTSTSALGLPDQPPRYS